MNHNKKKDKNGMTVLVVEPLKAPYLKVIPKGLHSLQREVGGHIEAIYPFGDPVAIIYHEDGKYQRLMPNRGLYDCDGQLYDFIAGTFLITGLTEENFASLSEELAAKYMEKYQVLEKPAFINDAFTMIPVLNNTKKEQEKKEKTAVRDSENKKHCSRENRKRNQSDEER